jgi:uncharacterized protein YdeI (YjbR/CyaY-like superfamily)
MIHDLPRRAFQNREELHDWLRENHRASAGIYLIYFKKGSGKESVTYEEAVEEALSFGWIDSTAHSIDRDRYMQLFTPRKIGSSWSRINKERVGRLISEGRMTPAGMEKVEAAKKDGSWESLDAIENLAVPSDLREALSEYPGAFLVFIGLPASTRKNIVRWVESAKRFETRKKRIEKTVSSMKQNIRTFPFPK